MASTYSKTRPISNVLLASTVANFPALVHSFDVTGANIGALRLTDSVSGAIAVCAALTNPTSNTFLASISSITGLVSPGTKSALYVYAATSATSTFSVQIGNPDVDFGITIIPAGTGLVSATSAGYKTMAATAITSPSAQVCGAVAVNWAGDTATKYMSENTKTTVLTGAGAATSGTIVSGITTIPQRMVLPSAGANATSGVYVFHFNNGLPSSNTIAEGIAWMATNPGYIAPHFRNHA